MHLSNRLKCNVITVDYRGYGLSTGTPSEDGLCTDARCVLDYCVLNARSLDIDATKLVVYGHSLGGAVAIALVKRKQDLVCGLILENTFYSFNRMILERGPAVIGRIAYHLTGEQWVSFKRIQSIQVPVLFLVGKKDGIINHTHSSDLFKLCTERRKRIHYFETGNHCNLVSFRMFSIYISQWFKEYVGVYIEIETDEPSDADDAIEGGIGSANFTHYSDPSSAEYVSA